MSMQVLEAFGEFGEPYLAVSNLPLRIGRIVEINGHPFAVARESSWDEMMAHHSKDLKHWELDPTITPKTHPYCYEFITD